MQPCARCGAEVADVTGFCLNCGPLVDMADFKDAMQFLRDRVTIAADLLAAGKVDDAIDMSLQLTRMDPTNAALHGLLGDLYRHQGTPRKATEAYQAAITANPATAARYRAKLDALIDSTLAREPRAETLVTPLPDAAPLPTAPTPRDHLVMAQAPKETALPTEDEMPAVLFGVIPLTPGNVRAVFITSAVIIAFSLLFAYHPWKQKPRPPTNVISLSEDDAPPPPAPVVGDGVPPAPDSTGIDAASPKGGR
jgi:hypothetical protein